MRFKGLDLNLLAALDALLDTRSVSRAAERLNLSQPAMSAALSRLRDYFRDELLVVQGKQMYPTPYAEVLFPQLKECLGGVDALISSSAAFDPAASHRTFSIIASDYVTAAILVPLVARLAEIAPGIRLDISLPYDDSADRLSQGKVDLLITLDAYVHPDHPTEMLFEERQVVVGWKENPLFQRTITEQDVFACGHVAVAMGRDRTSSFADRQLAFMGKARRVEVTAATFLVVPWLLRDTLRLALMHERLAKAVAAVFPISWAPVPFEFPLMREMVQHHQARERDEGLRWLRRQLADVCADS